MPALDPRSDFQDDGGTPEWRRRYQTIEVYPSRWAAARAYARRHPSVYLSLAVLAGLVPGVVFLIGFALIVAYDFILRLIALLPPMG